MPKLNPTIEHVPMPARIAALPVGLNGYPVPWFVAWVDGCPEFRAADGAKFARAVRERRCWVCGDRLTKYLTFLLGPMCGVNRTTAEPPCHTDCARYSARACPFLARPHMDRREGGLLEELPTTCAGAMIRRNPGVVALWTVRDYRLFRDERGGVLLRVPDPVQPVEWYAEGRPATRAEVEESVRTGLPLLRGMIPADAPADERDRSLAYLGVQVAALETLYPPP